MDNSVDLIGSRYLLAAQCRTLVVMATTAAETQSPTIPAWTLGDRIWKARRHAGLEQEQLGLEIGVSKSLVSKWERGQRDPRVAEVRSIARVTGVDERWLLAGELPLRGLRQPARHLSVITGGKRAGGQQRAMNLNALR